MHCWTRSVHVSRVVTGAWTQSSAGREAGHFQSQAPVSSQLGSGQGLWALHRLDWL